MFRSFVKSRPRYCKLKPPAFRKYFTFRTTPRPQTPTYISTKQASKSQDTLKSLPERPSSGRRSRHAPYRWNSSATSKNQEKHTAWPSTFLKNMNSAVKTDLNGLLNLSQSISKRQAKDPTCTISQDQSKPEKQKGIIKTVSTNRYRNISPLFSVR